MQDWDAIKAVENMQAYIVARGGKDVDMEALAAESGYSRYHAIRLFKQYTGQTPSAYCRSVQLTGAAVHLRDEGGSVLDTALDASFASHDGFTRAFAKRFGIAPAAYKKTQPPISMFTYYPISHALLHYNKRMEPEMDNAKVSATVTVQAVERPARKLLILRSKNATDYWSYCEEMGCDWEGLMNSVAEKFDTAALLELPARLVTPGTSAFVAGIEVPADYAKPVPAGMEILDLPAATMLYFHGAPYENEEDFAIAIGIVAGALQAYQPEEYGYAYAFGAAPRFNFGSTAKKGAKMAVPVVEA